MNKINSIRKIIAIIFFAALLFTLPLIIDFYLTTKIPHYEFGLVKITISQYSTFKTISPPKLFGVVEIMELIVIISYFSALRRGVWRVILGLAVLTTATFSFVILGFAQVLYAKPIYNQIAVQLFWISAGSQSLAIIWAVLGNIIERSSKWSYILPAALLIGGAVGIIVSRLPIVEETRCFAIIFPDWYSRRFSASESGYLIGITWFSLVYICRRIAAFIEQIFAPAMLRLNKQVRLVEYYYRGVSVCELQIVDPHWERLLVGSDLEISRQGRKYQGVPKVKEIKELRDKTQNKCYWYSLLLQIIVSIVLLIPLFITIAF